MLERSAQVDQARQWFASLHRGLAQAPRQIGLLPPGPSCSHPFFQVPRGPAPSCCPPKGSRGWGADLRPEGVVSGASLSSTSATGRGRPQTLGWYPHCPRDTHCSGVIISVVRDPAKSLALSRELASLLDKDAIEPVEWHTRLNGFYSVYFLIPKKDGGSARSWICGD